MKALIIKIAQILKLAKLLQIINAASIIETCKTRCIAHSQSCFGPTAIIKNSESNKNAIKVGAKTLVDGELLVHDYGGQIHIGESTYIGQGSRVWSGESVKIGNRVFVAHNVTITDTNSHQFSAQERADDYQRRIVEGKPFEKGSIKTAAVVIKDDAWINFGVGILKGVTIGEGAIVGAMSLVTKDVPPWTLVAGVPAKVIRKIEER